MRYTATLDRTSSGFVAQCVEIDALGEGSTREAAIRSLRTELEDQMSHVEGIAPPAVPAEISVDLVVAEDEAGAPSEQGRHARTIGSE
jgi:hypothetical protein